MKFLLSFFLLLCSLDANALYYCKCDSGAHASCSISVGNDVNDGSTAALAKESFPSAASLGSAAAGTTHRFCEGGSWTGLSASYVVENNNVTRTSPLTLTTYAPASGATGRPILEWAAGSAQGLVFGGFFTVTDHCGYVVDGLRFRRATTGGEGITLYGQTCHVTFNNIMVDNWANGMVPSTGSGLHHITVRNSWFGPNSQNGIIGNADDFLLENNTFDQNNNDGTGGEHGIYIGGCDARQRVTIRRNTFTNNSLNAGQCTSGNITTRGGNTIGLTVEENYIEVPYGSADCYGISVIEGYSSCTEHVENLVIRGNTVVNVGSNSIAVRLCTDCLIENNRVIRDNTSNTGFHYGISIDNPGDAADLAVSPATGAVIRNNSIYADRGSGAGISVTAGSNHKISNNAVHITANSSANCFAHSALSNFTVWNNNWCYEQGSGQWSGTYATLADAQAAFFDSNGGNTNPLWVSTPSTAAPTFATQSGSPLRSAGSNTYKSRFDAALCLRDSTPDVGAMEASGTPCLTFRAPVELR